MNSLTDFSEIYNLLNKHDGELFKLRMKMFNNGKDFSIKDAKELDDKYQVMERNYIRICHMLIRAYPEMMKLEAENNFMLRLINKHALGES